MLLNKKILFVLIAALGGVSTWGMVTSSTVSAQSGTRGSGSQGSGHIINQGSGSQGSGIIVQQETFESKFWNYLQSAKYRNWAPVPGTTGDAYKGDSPHGAFLKMYINRKAVGHMNKMPSGSIIIKENFGKDSKTLMAITVMYRNTGYNPKNGDWYWVKYNPDGSVANAPAEKGGMPLAGKVKGCINCHSGAEGNDFVFANDKK